MAVHLTRFDAADYLQTEDDMAAYLAECAEGDDPRLVAHALGAIARARNLSQLARDTGMTRAGLSRALAYDGNPSFATDLKGRQGAGVEDIRHAGESRPRACTAGPSRRTRPAAAIKRAKSRKVALCASPRHPTVCALDAARPASQVPFGFPRPPVDREVQGDVRWRSATLGTPGRTCGSRPGMTSGALAGV